MDLARTIATCAAALAACIAAFNGSRTLKRAREDSRHRSRPMVVAELREPPHTTAVQLLVIRNCGPVIARNVQITFDPPLPILESAEASQSVVPYMVRRYGRKIPVLTPGMELDNIWFAGQPGGDGWVNVEPLPNQFTVHIESTAPDGERYQEEFELDVDIIRQRTYVTSSRQPESIAKERLRVEQKIANAVAEIAKTTG